MPILYRRQITIWLSVCLFFILLIVIVGGSVRLTQSGLSMVEWKPITGVFPPLNEKDWNHEFEKYKQFPEYKKINQDITLEGYKFIYWWEYIHRMLGRLLGLVFLIPFLVFLWQKKIPKKFIKSMLFAFFLGGVQGVIGWLMVKSGLRDNPHVSHYRLALHLSLAYLIFCYFLWMILDMHAPHEKANILNRKNMVRLNRWIVGLLGVQIIYGAFVAGLKAGYIYNTFPLMGSSFFPDQFFSMSPLWQNFFDNKGVVQFIHRILAYCLLAGAGVFTYKIHKNFPEHKKYADVGFSLLLLQALLGVLTLIYAVPVWLGVLHQGNSLLLLSSYIFCWHRLSH